MRRWFTLAAGTGLLLAGCTDSRGPTQPTVRAPSFLETQDQHGPRTHIMMPRGQANPHKGGGNTGINYHGGPIIYSQNVAAIYWGAAPLYDGGPDPVTAPTGGGGADGSLVGFFLRNLGGSSYFNINTTYFDGTGTHVQNVVTYTQYWASNTNLPPTDNSPVDDATIQAKVEEGLMSGSLTYDPNTLYAVFTGSGVNLGGGFGSQYCAYHGYFVDSQLRNVKYAAMPYAYQFPSGCAALQGSPNNDPPADAVVNVLAHETEETTTDENLNAWYDFLGQENADKCAWQFGAWYLTTNGSKANENIGGKDFLIQMNWVNATTGKKPVPVGCRQGW